MSKLSQEKRAGKVSLGKKISYAVPAAALAVIGIPVYVYIPKFYTDVVGIDVTILGYLLFTVRIFDALTDPLIGYLSDRTTSRFGRRRPYIFIGVVFLAAMMLMLFNPPAAGEAMVTVWFAVAIYGLFLFWTVVTVPYESLGPEITFNYHERTTLFGYRDGFLLFGTLLAAAAPAMVDTLFQLPEGNDGERKKFFLVSVIYAPLLIATCWWCVLRVREQTRQRPIAGQPLFSGLRSVLTNRPFVILLVAYTISAIGNNLPATLILFYVEYVLHSDLADFFLLLYFVTGVVFLPGWIFLSRRTGKKRAWLASMGLNTGAFLGVFFLGPGDTLIYGILVFLSGIGFGATLAIPSAIQADVIDYDELLTGERREGQYIGLWSISKKMAAALGIGIGLFLLGFSGYTPNVQQNESVVFMLRILYALVPSLCNLAGILIALTYPLDEIKHSRILAAIEQRKKGGEPEDPLNSGKMIN